jgi:hypothetical protein
MNSAATAVGRFVRRTSLGIDEYRVNFKQIDCEVLDTLASDEACAVTPSMSRIYIRLIRAPSSCWERDGVLRFEGEAREGKILTAWEQLVELTGVANSTLSKALDWMHDAGVIGYVARKNGVGIRIFINRALSSIRSKPEKILRLVPAPSDTPPAPSDGMPFKESSSREDLDIDINPRTHPRAGEASDSTKTPSPVGAQQLQVKQCNTPALSAIPTTFDIGQVVGIVKRQLEPVIASTCQDAIASAMREQADKHREWLERSGIPKAVRVAQSETFSVLRAHGVIPKKASNSAYVGLNNASKSVKDMGTEVSKIGSFITETLDVVRQAAAETAVSEQPAVRDALSEVEKDLGELSRRITQSERSVPPDLEIIEEKLVAAEDLILGALLRSTDPGEVKKMIDAASTDLQKYKLTMNPEVYEETVKRYVMARVRERHGIPRMSLFYLEPAPS